MVDPETHMRSWLEINFLKWELVVTETSSWGREFQTGITREEKKNLERVVPWMEG